MAEQLADRSTVLREVRDAEARRDLESQSLDLERPVECGDQGACRVDRLLLALDVLENECELIAAEPGEHRLWRHGVLQPGGDVLQNEVTELVTQGVVDGLEI